MAGGTEPIGQEHAADLNLRLPQFEQRLNVILVQINVSSLGNQHLGPRCPPLAKVANCELIRAGPWAGSRFGSPRPTEVRRCNGW